MPLNGGPQCGKRTRAGTACKNNPILGATVCKKHGGGAPKVRAKAAVRAEVMAWGLGDAHQDPGEVLLRLVTQSAVRVERYAVEVERMVELSEGDLQEALISDAKIWDPVAKKTVKVGEYVRAMVALENSERDRCASFATKAVAAGLAKRTVELAERQGQLIAELLRAVLLDPEMGLSDEQRRAMPGVARKHLTALAAG